jgi:hypothetical protein
MQIWHAPAVAPGGAGCQRRARLDGVDGREGPRAEVHGDERAVGGRVGARDVHRLRLLQHAERTVHHVQQHACAAGQALKT